MKFLHLSDLHIGKRLNDFDLIEDQKFILDEIVSFIVAEKIDSVLISGDVYDQNSPSEAAFDLFNDLLCKLAGCGVNVFIISGNHDSDVRLNYASNLLVSNKIFISSIYDGTIRKETVTDEHGEIDIYMLPYIKKSQVERFFPDAKIKTYEDAVKTVLEHADIDKNRRNVILAHQFVIGSGDPELSGSETVSVGTVDSVSYKLFDDFDYVALGHIHRPQKVGRDTVRYAGSLLKYSVSECNGDKSVPVVTIGKKGDVTFELRTFAPRRNLRHIKGKLQDVIENAVDTDDYVYITLTDEDTVDDVKMKLQRTYPNVVKIDYDNARIRGIMQSELMPLTEDKSYEDIVKDFYKSIYGIDISDEELAIMMEIGGEVGIIDETD